jgi:hypothetical protein
LRTLLRRALTHKSNSERDLCKINFTVKDYKTLLTQQHAIGWEHIHQGRLSLEWDRHQRRFLNDVGDEDTNAEPAWIQRSIYKILDSHHQRWKCINAVLHEDKQGTRHTQALLFQRVKVLYAYKDKLLPQDRLCFTTYLETWEGAEEHELKSWIQVHESHIRTCATLAKLQSTRLMSNLHAHGFEGATFQREEMIKSPSTRQQPPAERIIKSITRSTLPRRNQHVTMSTTQVEATSI